MTGCGPLNESYVSQIAERRKENVSSEEAIEFDFILRQIENGFGEKDEYLQGLGEICGRADAGQFYRTGVLRCSMPPIKNVVWRNI